MFIFLGQISHRFWDSVADHHNNLLTAHYVSGALGLTIVQLLVGLMSILYCLDYHGACI